MGPVYSGTIESMHMEKSTVQKATLGQQIGIKIRNFNKVKIGDFVESFRPAPVKKAQVWQPKGEIIRTY
jgi:translation initiation factor IF-2